MLVTEIDRRRVTLELVPEDCLRLSQACTLAAWDVSGMEAPDALRHLSDRSDIRQLFESFATLFAMATMAVSAEAYVVGTLEVDTLSDSLQEVEHELSRRPSGLAEEQPSPTN